LIFKRLPFRLAVAWIILDIQVSIKLLSVYFVPGTMLSSGGYGMDKLRLLIFRSLESSGADIQENGLKRPWCDMCSDKACTQNSLVQREGT
jgi:hypothetical protein